MNLRTRGLRQSRPSRLLVLPTRFLICRTPVADNLPGFGLLFVLLVGECRGRPLRIIQGDESMLICNDGHQRLLVGGWAFAFGDCFGSHRVFLLGDGRQPSTRSIGESGEAKGEAPRGFFKPDPLCEDAHVVGIGDSPRMPSVEKKRLSFSAVSIDVIPQQGNSLSYAKQLSRQRPGFIFSRYSHVDTNLGIEDHRQHSLSVTSPGARRTVLEEDSPGISPPPKSCHGDTASIAERPSGQHPCVTRLVLWLMCLCGHEAQVQNRECATFPVALGATYLSESLCGVKDSSRWVLFIDIDSHGLAASEDRIK